MQPNFQLRFYQLWAALFRFSVATADEKLSQAPEATLTYINGAISLFAPQIKTGNDYHQRTAQLDERIALEKAQVSLDSQSTTIVRLVQAISHHLSAYVVLFSSDAVSTTPKAIIGAYFLGPLYVTSTEAENEKCETRNYTSHLLFQLWPRFCLLQWTNPDVPLTDLINTEGNKVSLAKIATSEDLESLNVPYWIGHPMGQCAGLRIDPEKKTATLAGSDEHWYIDVSAEGNNGLSKNWEVTIQNARMDIFTVTGGVDQELKTGPIAKVEDLPKHRPHPPPHALEHRVEGEELLERIQGFGSS